MSSSRIHTLVTYEQPAARHMIDDWINGRRDIVAHQVTDAHELVRLESGEALYMIPVVDGNTFNVFQELDGGRSYYKWLHFGKVFRDATLYTAIMEALT